MLDGFEGREHRGCLGELGKRFVGADFGVLLPQLLHLGMFVRLGHGALVPLEHFNEGSVRGAHEHRRSFGCHAEAPQEGHVVAQQRFEPLVAAWARAISDDDDLGHGLLLPASVQTQYPRRMDRQLPHPILARGLGVDGSLERATLKAGTDPLPVLRPRLSVGRVSGLDGLRGLAGLLVLFHHTLQVPTGGFLGVDIFFVLSGFLISSLILDEIGRNGSLDFKRFYWRRVVRLIPAFICMVLLYQALRVSVMPGLTWVGPRRAAEILFLSNWTTVTPYLGHSWSLSIEWQFYCVWPTVIALAMRYGFGTRGVAAIAVLGVCCLWAATVFSGMNVARGCGLFLGSALAALAGEAWFRNVQRCLTPKIGSFLMGLALALLLTLCFWASYKSPWMGQWVYASVAILTLIIVFLLSGGGSALGRGLLGNRVMVHFGRISYGLYLYHFPIAAVMYSHHLSPLAMLLAGLFVAVPLADCSWRYLEQPLLRAENCKSRSAQPVAS